MADEKINWSMNLDMSLSKSLSYHQGFADLALVSAKLAWAPSLAFPSVPSPAGTYVLAARDLILNPTATYEFNALYEPGKQTTTWADKMYGVFISNVGSVQVRMSNVVGANKWPPWLSEDVTFYCDLTPGGCFVYIFGNDTTLPLTDLGGWAPQVLFTGSGGLVRVAEIGVANP